MNTVTGAIGKVRGKLGSLVSFATGPVAAAMAGIGGGAAIAGMVGIAASTEQTETQFKTLLGSTEAAKQKMKELQTFAASTPFQFEGLANSAKMLLAFGTSSEQIVPTMKVLGDISAATGNNLEELSGIYGKVQSRGALMTESLDQFNERGIPLGRKLAEMWGKSGEEIREMASKGQISFADMQKAMTEMTSEGGMAFNGMASQATTLSGVWSTMKDNVTLVLGDIGAAIVEGFDLKGATTNLTGFVQKFRGEWMPSIVDSIKWVNSNLVQPFIDTTKRIGSLIYDLVVDFDLYWDLAVAHIASAMLDGYEHVKTFFENSVALGGWLLDSTTQVFKNIIANGTSIFASGVEALKANWDVLVDHMSGREPDTAAFAKAITNYAKVANQVLKGVEIEPPEMKEAQLGGMQGEIDAINDRIHQRQMAREAERQKKSEAAQSEKVEGLKIEDDAKKKIIDESTEVEDKKAAKTTKDRVGLEKQITEEKKRQGGFSSLSDFADQAQQKLLSGGSRPAMAGIQAMGRMQAGAGGVADAKMERVAQAANRQTVLIEKLVTTIEGGKASFKVVPVNGPAVDPKQTMFGPKGRRNG